MNALVLNHHFRWLMANTARSNLIALGRVPVGFSLSLHLSLTTAWRQPPRYREHRYVPPSTIASA